MLAGRRGAKKTTADPCGMTNKKADPYGMTNKKQATGVRRPTGVSTKRRLYEDNRRCMKTTGVA
jgi:hypothetical protein